MTTTIGWYAAEMAWFRRITDIKNEKTVGKTVMTAIEHIRTNPVDARTRKEREEDNFRPKITKYKSHKAFDKNYLWCAVIYQEDGSYIICPGGHNETEFVYDEEANKSELPTGTSAEVLGGVIIDSFTDMELFYAALK